MVRMPPFIAAVAAIGLLGFGVVKGTWAVGGSDSSCYGLMAEAFADGQLQPSTHLATAAPWPDAARTFAPAGFIPSPVRAGAASPICSPGFSLLLAPFRWVAGPDGLFVVTPFAGALLIWLTFVFGRRVGGARAGAACAVIVATTPIVLFQVTQPMNDITVAMLWMAVLAAATTSDPSRPWLLGASTGLAILVRPNLAPAAAVVALWLTIETRRARGATPALLRRNLIAFALASLPGVAAMLALNVALYGHPLQSGYGSTRELFSLRHVSPNLRQYGTALIQTQLGLPLLGIAALAATTRGARSVAALVLLVSASVLAVYLPYQVFPEWWYLRFLLPALVPLTALAAVAAMRLVLGEHPRNAARTLMGIIVLALLGWHGVVTARERHAFDLQRLERRFRQTGMVVREVLPADAIFITVWHSGTIRFHANRLSLLWDSLDPQALDSSIAWLSSRGFEPYLVLERWEEPLFRERFSAHSAFGGVDWPPRFDIDRQVRIFRPSDRATYMQGEPIPTEYIVSRSRRPDLE
jgi:hypothetical protein